MTIKKYDSELLIENVPSKLLINTNEKISNCPLGVFQNQEDFKREILGTDPKLPITLLPLDEINFRNFAYGEKTAFILPTDYYIDHEDKVLVLCINENYYPTGEWIWIIANVQITSLPSSPVYGLSPHYSVVILERQTWNKQRPPFERRKSFKLKKDNS